MTNPFRMAGLALAAALSITFGVVPTANAGPGNRVLAEAPPSDQQFIGAIEGVIGSGHPLTIVNVVSPQSDWYVVTMRDTSIGQNAKVVLQQANGPLEVVAGPGGYFPTISVPDPVRKYLASVGAV
jgi:hypothetical protein